MLIEKIISHVNLEDDVTEFKSIIKEGIKDDKSNERLEFGWLKEIVGFANSQGGTMFIGVDNITHEVYQLSHQEVDKIVLMIHRLIKEHIEPHIVYRISQIEIPDTSPIKYIIKLEVDKSKMLPVQLKFNNVNSIYVRHFGKTSMASTYEIIDLVNNSQNYSYDELFTNEIFNKEDFTYLFNYYYQVHNKQLSIKELISIGFINDKNYLSKGALLFKDCCNLENSSANMLVECTWFNGIFKGDNTFLATEKICCNLLEEFDKIKTFILSRSAQGFVKTIDGQEKLISYPLRSLHEGIVNALVHRDYYIRGSQIEINLFKDRLEIISPGCLLNSIRLLKEKNLSEIPPLRRNQIICNVFAMLNLMEKKGSGFDKIELEYSSYADKYKPYVTSNYNSFLLCLPDLTYKGGYLDEESISENNIYVVDKLDGKHDLEILAFCYFKSRKVSEISKKLNINPSSYFRNNTIKKLVDNDYLLATIEDKVTKYMTNKDKVFIK